MAKLKLWAPIISSVGNLQMSVGKLQLPASPTFVTHYSPDHCTVVNVFIFFIKLNRCIEYQESASHVRHTQSSAASCSVRRNDWRSTCAILPTNFAGSQHIQRQKLWVSSLYDVRTNVHTYVQHSLLTTYCKFVFSRCPIWASVILNIEIIHYVSNLSCDIRAIHFSKTCGSCS